MQSICSRSAGWLRSLTGGGTPPQIAEPPPEPVTCRLLRQQDAETSNAIIAALRKDDGFQRLAKSEGAAIVKRDAEDDAKLAKGIELSISRGVLPKIPPPEVTKIDVRGKTPSDVVAAIRAGGAGSSGGCVIVLQGMSGTGKGTTASELLKGLPRTASWSNGNLFRSLTLLAVTEFGDKVKDDSATVVTPENVARWMGMLSFVKLADQKYDILIKGAGHDVKVSDVQNTLLKEKKVGSAIPSVAQYTQGDVVKFAAAALGQMADDGMNVILEGRGPTVQYVPTPYRFELVLPDEQLLGQRRAAQRVGAKAEKCAPPGAPDDTDATALVEQACGEIVREEKL